MMHLRHEACIFTDHEISIFSKCSDKIFLVPKTNRDRNDITLSVENSEPIWATSKKHRYKDWIGKPDPER